MNSKVYRWCAVPQCDNTSKRTPNKLFVHVPHKKTIRYKWLNLARRDPKAICLSSPIYFCEDHFDLPNDMDNYMQYHVMGSVSQVRMKPGCVPTKFECQPDRRKGTSTAERPYILKKRKKTLIKQCEKDLQDRSTTTKHLKLGETSNGSTAPVSCSLGDTRTMEHIEIEVPAFNLDPESSVESGDEGEDGTVLCTDINVWLPDIKQECSEYSEYSRKAALVSCSLGDTRTMDYGYVEVPILNLEPGSPAESGDEGEGGGALYTDIKQECSEYSTNAESSNERGEKVRGVVY